MKSTWDFVEKYYPNYHSCDTIAYSDDLIKILDEEYEYGDSSYKLLMKDYEGDNNDPQITSDYNNVMKIIYERAIEGFIYQQSNK